MNLTVTINKIDKIITVLFIRIISVYQKTLSPDHGFGRFWYPRAGCRFYPSCSEYTKQSLERFGFVKGFFASIKRIARCNPFNQGGVDLVPKT